MSSHTVISPIKVRAPVSAKRAAAVKKVMRRAEDLHLVEFNPQQHLEELTDLLMKDTDEEVKREFMFPSNKISREELSVDGVRRMVVHLRLKNEHAIAFRIIVKTHYSAEIAVGHAQIVKAHSTDEVASVAKFYISKMFRKRGYEEKALINVLHKAFHFFNVTKIVISCFESNEYYIKLLMQLGFRLSKAFSKSIIQQKRYFLILNRDEFDYNLKLNWDKLLEGQPYYMKKPPTRGISQERRGRVPQPKSHSDMKIKLPPIRYPITELNLQSIKHVSFKLPENGVAPSSSLDIATTADTSKRSKQVVVSNGRAGSNGEFHSVTFTASPQLSQQQEEDSKKIVLMAPFFSPPKTRIHSQFPQYYSSGTSGLTSLASKSDTKSLAVPRLDVEEYMNSIKVSKQIPKSYVRQYMSRKAGGAHHRGEIASPLRTESDLERQGSSELDSRM